MKLRNPKKHRGSPSHKALTDVLSRICEIKEGPAHILERDLPGIIASYKGEHMQGLTILGELIMGHTRTELHPKSGAEEKAISTIKKAQQDQLLARYTNMAKRGRSTMIAELGTVVVQGCSRAKVNALLGVMSDNRMLKAAPETDSI